MIWVLMNGKVTLYTVTIQICQLSSEFTWSKKNNFLMLCLLLTDVEINETRTNNNQGLNVWTRRSRRTILWAKMFLLFDLIERLQILDLLNNLCKTCRSNGIYSHKSMLQCEAQNIKYKYIAVKVCFRIVKAWSAHVFLLAFFSSFLSRMHFSTIQ